MLCNIQRFSYFKLARKARFWKAPYYPAIPHYMQPQLRDPHDEYQLRSKQEIIQQQEENPPKFQVTIDTIYFPDTEKYKTHYNRKVKLTVNMDQMKLSKLQKDRLITLLGNRYKNNDVMKLTVDVYETWEQNYAKGMEQLKELYLESLRAP